MRLIDADAFKETLKEIEVDCEDRRKKAHVEMALKMVSRLIDDEPTIGKEDK